MTITPDEKRRRNNEYMRRRYQAHREEICAKERAREKPPRSREQRDRKNAADRARYEAMSPEQRENCRAKNRRSWGKHKDKYNARSRKNQDWRGKEDRYRARQEAKAGRPRPTCCEVCGNDKARIVFDHCHQRGIFRGWLCSHCNVILGHAKDDPNRLRKLIAYLERTKILISPQLTLPGI
jgi:hypothetical protein